MSDLSGETRCTINYLEFTLVNVLYSLMYAPFLVLDYCKIQFSFYFKLEILCFQENLYQRYYIKNFFEDVLCKIKLPQSRKMRFAITKKEKRQKS